MGKTRVKRKMKSRFCVECGATYKWQCECPNNTTTANKKKYFKQNSKKAMKNAFSYEDE